MQNNFWDEFYHVDTIQKSKNKQIQASYVRKNNAEGLDIREFYKEGEIYLPGKGLMVPYPALGDFFQLMHKAREFKKEGQ